MQDSGQERTVQKLQDLYDSLRKVHPPKKRRPSGLTVVDSVDAQAQSSGGGWCVLLSTACNSFPCGFDFFFLLYKWHKAISDQGCTQPAIALVLS